MTACALDVEPMLPPQSAHPLFMHLYGAPQQYTHPAVPRARMLRHQCTHVCQQDAVISRRGDRAEGRAWDLDERTGTRHRQPTRDQTGDGIALLRRG